MELQPERLGRNIDLSVSANDHFSSAPMEGSLLLDFYHFPQVKKKKKMKKKEDHRGTCEIQSVSHVELSGSAGAAAREPRGGAGQRSGQRARGDG